MDGIPLPSVTSADGFLSDKMADANDNWDDEAPRGSVRVVELEFSGVLAGVNVAVSAGQDPASEIGKGECCC